MFGSSNKQDEFNFKFKEEIDFGKQFTFTLLQTLIY